MCNESNHQPDEHRRHLRRYRPHAADQTGRIMHYFTSDELTAILKVAYQRNPLHHLAMLTSVCHGLRVSELLGLEPEDVMPPYLSLGRLKGEKAQLQPLHASDNPLFDEARLRLLAYERERIAGRHAPSRIFPVCRQRLDQIIRRTGKLAGVPPVKCH